MAKQELQSWARTLLAIMAIIFAGGGYAMKVNSNSGCIKVNTSDIKENTTAIHSEALARTQMIGKIDATKEDVAEIKSDFKELKGYLMQYDFNKKEK